MAGINGLLKKKEEEDKGRKREISLKKEDINRMKKQW
jgi:hypothetical protein